MKAKIIILMVLIVLFIIFVTQNTLVIPINIFFWSVQMSVIVLMSLCALMGVVVGFILLRIFDKPAKKNVKNTVDTKTEVSRGNNPIL